MQTSWFTSKLVSNLGSQGKKTKTKKSRIICVQLSKAMFGKFSYHVSRFGKISRVFVIMLTVIWCLSRAKV